MLLAGLGFLLALRAPPEPPEAPPPVVRSASARRAPPAERPPPPARDERLHRNAAARAEKLEQLERAERAPAPERPVSFEDDLPPEHGPEHMQLALPLLEAAFVDRFGSDHGVDIRLDCDEPPCVFHLDYDAALLEQEDGPPAPGLLQGPTIERLKEHVGGGRFSVRTVTDGGRRHAELYFTPVTREEDPELYDRLKAAVRRRR